jgi:hypothetical protein
MKHMIALLIFPFILFNFNTTDFFTTISTFSPEPNSCVQNDPPIYYTGTIEIKYILKKAYPSFSDPVQMTEEESSYSSAMDITSCPGCIDKLKNPAVLQSIIQEQTDYGILYGRTSADKEGKRTTTFANKKTKESSDRFGEFLTDVETKVQTESNGGEIRFSVQPFVRTSSEGLPLLDTQTQYCMLITMGHSNDIYTNPSSVLYQGTGTKTERTAADEVQTTKIQFDQAFYVGGFNFDYRQGQNDDDRIIIPLEIESPKTLEEYIKNPKGSFSLQLHGKVYENNGEEIIREIWINLKFTANQTK